LVNAITWNVDYNFDNIAWALMHVTVGVCKSILAYGKNMQANSMTIENSLVLLQKNINLYTERPIN